MLQILQEEKSEYLDDKKRYQIIRCGFTPYCPPYHLLCMMPSRGGWRGRSLTYPGQQGLGLKVPCD